MLLCRTCTRAATAVIRNVAVAVTALQLVRALTALLDAVQQEHEHAPNGVATTTGSIKSYVQLGKLVLMIRRRGGDAWRAARSLAADPALGPGAPCRPC